MVSYPLTVRDCCLITDGGGAVIMTTDEGARSLKKTAGLCPRLRPGDYSCQYFEHARSDRDWGPDIGAYATARLGPGDIDIVELYDAFTPSHSTRSFSARSRLLPERGAGPFVSDGHFELGRSALNTNGGPLPYAIPACTERSC